MTVGSPDPSQEDARLESLEERLARAQHREAVRTGKQAKKADDGTVAGNRVLADLIGGPLGGFLVGWVIDRVAGTSPWFAIGMAVAGLAAAFWQIIKRGTARPPKQGGRG